MNSDLNNDSQDCTLYMVHPAEAIGKELCFNEEIISVHGGSSHVVFCDVTGSVYGYGSNKQGQLGIGRYSLIEDPSVLIPNLPPCKQIACGYEYSIFLTRNGEVFGCGECQYGQLGIGKKVATVTRPVKASFFEERGLIIERIACGFYHTICLTSKGRLYSFGHGHNGQCGVDISTDPEISTPILIEKLKDHFIINIATGGYHTVVMTRTNQIFAFGLNTSGQLGLGHTSEVHFPAEVQFKFAIPKRIVCGGEFSSIVTRDDLLYSTGANSDGQLGQVAISSIFRLMNFPEEVFDITHGKYHNVILSKKKQLFLSGFSVQGTRVRQFRNADQFPDFDYHKKRIRSMMLAETPFRSLRLETTYSNILFYLEPLPFQIPILFEKLKSCPKFHDVLIKTCS
jgi:alpha-tubulin suppressor-like RCC1 family protein